MEGKNERWRERICSGERIKRGEQMRVRFWWKKARDKQCFIFPLLLCSVFLPVLSWSFYQTVYHYQLNALGGAFILRLSFKPTDNNHLIIPPSAAVGLFLSVVLCSLCKNSPYNCEATIIPSGCVQLPHFEGKHILPWCVPEMQIDAWNIDIKSGSQNSTGFLDPADRRANLTHGVCRDVVFQVNI